MMDAAMKQKIKAHVMNHHDGFPATKKDLVTACENMMEFDEDTKEWVEKTLPIKTYKSAEEVTMALGI